MFLMQPLAAKIVPILLGLASLIASFYNWCVDTASKGVKKGLYTPFQNLSQWEIVYPLWGH